ncbi:nucleoporin 62 like [Platichthys flesus]|uniref:nucleoporin 62 like n=1 Tax=Platichthys flesus TaxID=8260 RepID=UPI002DBCFB65|nr:nucleoporin 62 like [Platichthys flesus]
MSGGFNFGQPTGGFAFGAQKPTAAAAPAPGFGMQSSTPVAPAGGFSFGTPAQPTANSGGGFSFGTPAKSTAAGGGGFSFGTPTSNAFGLGATPQPTATAQAPGMTLGSVAAPVSMQGFSMGGAMSQQTTAAPPAGGGFSFGTAPQAQPQLAAPAPAQAAPAQATQAAAAATQAAAAAAASGGLSFGSFSFGAATKVQATTAAAATLPTGGGFGFGTSAPSNLTMGIQPQPVSIAAAPTPQGGGFGFGIKPSSTPAPPASTQPAPAVGPTLFSMPFTTVAASAPAAAAAAPAAGFMQSAAPTSLASTAPAITTAASGGLAFMLKPLGAAPATSTPAAAPASTAAATTGAPVAFSLGLKPASGMSTITAPTSITTTTAPPVMSYAQLEGLINKWSLELEDQERHFLQQATQVNAWDRMLVENGEKITSLHKEMEKVKLDQRRLNQELDFILSQQKELEDVLCPLEESVKEQSGTIYMQNADEERERTYKLAENVDAQLKRMSQDLKEIIEHLNTSSGPADTSDPLQQICKILNAHMDSLQWIDQNSVLLHRRVEEVSKMCDNQRKEQEKTFRLTFD